MTVDIYGHLVEGDNRSAVDKLDDLETEESPDTGSKLVADDSPISSADS